MTLFHHWVVDCSVRHQEAIRAARGLGAPGLTGRTPAEAEVSRLTIALIEKLHSLETLVREFGADEVFGPRSSPVSPEEKRAAQLGVSAGRQE